jgi:protein N-terminal amidase
LFCIFGGPGFATLHLPPPLNTVTLGICMDLNPRSPWTPDGGPYELAEHCLKTGSSLLVLLNAWLDSGVELDNEDDISTMNFWATRLRPLWYRTDKDSGSNGEHAEPPSAPEDSETIVVVCNRSGVENGQQPLLRTEESQSPH